MNKSYAKLINGHIHYALSVLDTPGGIIMNPKRLSYLQAGWKFLDLQPPADPAPEGKEYAISGYTETATDIRPVFKLIAHNLPPRTFSKLRLVTALTKRGIWSAFRDWLTETDLYDFFLVANDFREDHPPNSPRHFPPPNPASTSPHQKPPRYWRKAYEDFFS